MTSTVEDEATNLGDLAIVCANCHAMIHRGRQCRHLVGLVPRGPTLIRPAVIADEGHVTELAAEFGKFGDYVPVFLRMLHHRHPIGYGVGQDVELLVHLDGSGMPVGFGAVEWHASHADLHGIAVHPRSRRRGVAANLLDHVSGSATGRGILELRCNTAAKANPAALGFFTTRGFDVVGPAPFNFPMGQAAVQLRRRLD